MNAFWAIVRNETVQLYRDRWYLFLLTIGGMASLVSKPIIVPPEPGLMGAFGVALEVKKRIEAGLLEAKHFDLQTLADRQVVYKKPFTCKGGKEKCDRGCEIAMIEIEGQKYPFG